MKLLQKVLLRGRIIKDFFVPTPQCKSILKNETLTDDVVNRLIGHTNVVYYNCELNTWNTNIYNDYKIDGQEVHTDIVKGFKSAMEKMPEFHQQYEFAASVTMTIDSASHPGKGKAISNPQYDSKGTAVVGNMIVKNKTTGRYELYCKSWVGVFVYIFPQSAVKYGAYRFACNGARDYGFRAALISTHVR